MSRMGKIKLYNEQETEKNQVIKKKYFIIFN